MQLYVLGNSHPDPAVRRASDGGRYRCSEGAPGHKETVMRKLRILASEKTRTAKLSTCIFQRCQ
ncbi:hypothetical protein E2C01_059125 [Portunus trituberculatus]|uniref:Uncharacterized protein n=1 Tax=Portunus trituberculatus TaxID=210409 RepID=A0A5B7H1P8_PORTR|nr:hypothetical protein [Portunus trituberculatus]